MQLLLDDDSKDECLLDPCKELTEYLESKCEDQKEGLVEWWGVSLLAYHHVVLLTDCYHFSTIPFTTPPSPALHKTNLPFKGLWLPHVMMPTFYFLFLTLS
jgi:hypothetical protein